MKVLVIEDNADIMAVMKYIITEERHEVIECTDGTCVNNLLSIKPHLIFIDELLPGLKGSELCRHIKTHPQLKHIPVILTSAAQGANHIAMQCEADGFIEKPFNITSVTEIITKFLGSKD